MYYKEYMITKDINLKNIFLHLVIDDGMQKIVNALDKSFCNKYIELYPKNNVIFENGSTIDKKVAQDEYYINLYENQIKKRFYMLLNNM